MLTEALPEGDARGLQQTPHRLDLPVPLPNSHPDPSSAASTTLPLQVQSLSKLFMQLFGKKSVFLSKEMQRDRLADSRPCSLSQVVDTNVTSLVTPRLTRALKCHDHEPQTCTPSSCLNGGRCVGPNTEKRCVNFVWTRDVPRGTSTPGDRTVKVSKQV